MDIHSGKLTALVNCQGLFSWAKTDELGNKQNPIKRITLKKDCKSKSPNHFDILHIKQGPSKKEKN